MASIYSMKQPGMSIYGINMHAGDLAPAQQQSGVQDGAVVDVPSCNLVLEFGTLSCSQACWTGMLP